MVRSKQKLSYGIVSIFIIAALFVNGLGVVVAHNNSNENGILQQKNKIVSFSPLTTTIDNSHAVIKIGGADEIFLKKNYYQVPMQIETFTFPVGTKIISISCTPRDVSFQKLTHEPKISSEPIIVGQPKPIKNNEVKEKHSIETWYSYDIGSGLMNDNERGIIVKIQLFPVRYSPLTQKITYAKTMDIHIEYQLPEPQVSQRVLADQYSFLIITPTAFSADLAPLVQHKINFRNITTKLVTIDEIKNSVYFPVQGRDDAEKIKYFIKNATESWNTKNVLLVGGSSQLPTRTTYVYIINDGQVDPDVPQGYFVSDLYYADIYNKTGDFASWDTNNNNRFGEYNYNNEQIYDEVDLYPDVHLGRLACVNQDEVITSVNKIITYETGLAYEQSWFKKIVVLGGDSFPGDTHHVDEGEYANMAILNIMSDFIPTKLFASNGGLSPNGITKINNALNEGAGFVDFSGHGNDASWSTHPHESSVWYPQPGGSYKNTDVAGLTNGNKLPIVITSACSIAKFNKNIACFSWSFVSTANGGGIASFGSTGIGWGYTGTDVILGCIEGIAQNTFKAYKIDKVSTIGEMLTGALNRYFYPEMDEYDYKTVEEWILFGDPTLAINHDPTAPEKPQKPNGPTSGKINMQYTYTTSTTDINGEDTSFYYYFDWGDGTTTNWIGPYDYSDTAGANHKWTKDGIFTVRVKAKDDTNLESEWSDSVQVTITNDPPTTPTKPVGSSNGLQYIEYSYSTSATDVNSGEQLFYNFSWGDTTYSQWFGPYTSGTIIQKAHIWETPGEYEVKVKVKDSCDVESIWSESIQVVIVENSNQPPLTPNQPSGLTEGVVNINYSYSTTTTDPNDDQVWYKWSFGSVETEWIGPYASADETNIVYAWTNPGTQELKVKAKDANDAQSSWSEPLSVTIMNDPPVQPDKPVGSTQGEPGDTIMFSTKSTDPNSDQICYGWDWNNDAIADEWTELFDSGATIQTTHVFPNAGTYTIKVIAKDTHDACSSWSDPLTVIITQKTPLLTIESITGGKEGIITAVIKNTGTAAAINVTWSITIEGGLKIFVNQSQGSIDTLAVDTTSTLTLTGKKFLGVGLGFGKIVLPPVITVKIRSDNSLPIERAAVAKLFFRSITI